MFCHQSLFSKVTKLLFGFLCKTAIQRFKAQNWQNKKSPLLWEISAYRKIIRSNKGLRFLFDFGWALSLRSKP